MENIPFGICHCGCQQSTHLYTKHDPRRGHVKGQPARYLRGHNRWKSPLHYVVDEQTGCWIWQKGTNGVGYGMTYINKRPRLAHVHFYESAFGSVPKGLVLDHTCRNPICVNPLHQDPVTIAENNRRGRSTKITPDQVKQILSLKDIMMIKEIAALFHLSPTNVSEILNGYHWGQSIDRTQRRVRGKRYRVKRWSLHYTCCIKCQTTERPHQALGLCKTCYRRYRYEKQIIH